MKIDPNDPKLSAYVLGELDGKERTALEERLRNDPEARQLVEGIRKTVGALREHLKDEPALKLSDTQRAAIATKLKPPPHHARNTRKAGAWVGLGIAACALIACGLFAVASWKNAADPPQEVAQRRQAKRIEERPGKALKQEQIARLTDRARKLLAQHDYEQALQLTRQIERLDPENTLVADNQKMLEQLAALNTDPTLGNQQRQVSQVPLTETPWYMLAMYPDDWKELTLKREPYAVTFPLEEAKVFYLKYGFKPDLPAEGAFGSERYDRIIENRFLDPLREPLSTFSIDVDTASYANVRRFLNQGEIPPRGAVRIEEMINYFTYEYPDPEGEHPFSVNVEIASSPWNTRHRLARIGLKGKEIDPTKRPPNNLVFLLDVSGSMKPQNKLPLLKRAMMMLLLRLGKDDRVGIVTYSQEADLALPSTPCDQKAKILAALEKLQGGGSTNGGAGIELAYRQAVENFIKDGVNRVILCTDGDFNVGVTKQDELVHMIEEKAKRGVFLSVLGFGVGNLKDSTLEKLADKGNGNYAYIDTIQEARKVLVEQMLGTLLTIAKDVKIQIEFNPGKVAAYRLIGYENRVLSKEDFNDDSRDAGEIGAGHTVTALYEIVPTGAEIDVPIVGPLKYQKSKKPSQLTKASKSGEIMTLKLRYKVPDGDKSKLLTQAVTDSGAELGKASEDFRFASAVAGFGMILRDSKYSGNFTLDHVIKLAESGKAKDADGYRAEFIRLVKTAQEIRKTTTK